MYSGYPFEIQLLKVCLSLAISVTAIVLYKTKPGVCRKGVMTAMLVCTLGDVFMTDLIGIGDVSTYPGAVLFIIAHILYGMTFKKSAAGTEAGYKNTGLKRGFLVMTASAAVLAVLALAVPETPQYVMLVLILVYIAAIGFNVCSQFAYGFAAGGRARVLPWAAVLFYVSDICIFLGMLDITELFNNAVWFLYLPAQLLIVLFNSNAEKTVKQN